MEALNIISAEHRRMWRLASALDTVCDGLRHQIVASEAHVAAMMLDYLSSYFDRMHHPKEDQYLFRLLRLRAPDETTDIERLEAEHQRDPELLARLQSMANAIAEGDNRTSEQFFDELTEYTDALRAHIRLEEMSVMRRARAVLTTADWDEIDAAFLDNDDPIFGVHARAEFDALRSRITALAPAPVGLGGETAPVDQVFHVPVSIPVEDRAEVLSVTGLISSYGRIQALHGVDLIVKEGQLIALVGANGAGKTTLLKVISGVQPASSGKISFFGNDITQSSPDKRVRAGICQVPEGRQMFGPMSVEDNLALGAFTRPKAEVDDMREQMYALFPILKEKRKLAAGTLSGGQQQMLAMARALMGKPKLLLLDEPSMGLAPLLVEEIFQIVKNLKARGITIFLVEQNAHAALSIADVGYVLETGSIALSGPGKELLANEKVKSAYLGM